jgi:hypothetical protein
MRGSPRRANSTLVRECGELDSRTAGVWVRLRQESNERIGAERLGADPVVVQAMHVTAEHDVDVPA